MDGQGAPFRLTVRKSPKFGEFGNEQEKQDFGEIRNQLYYPERANIHSSASLEARTYPAAALRGEMRGDEPETSSHVFIRSAEQKSHSIFPQI